jgi:biopolymer transport protein ExbD
MAAGPATGKGAAHAAWVMNLLTDLAFNLLIFFVVCASSAQEQKGKPQQVPSTQGEKNASETKPQNIEVAITRTTVSLNGAEVKVSELRTKVAALLANKARPEDKIVEVKSAKDTPYSMWIRVTGAIEEAGGIVTLQVEVEKDVIVK